MLEPAVIGLMRSIRRISLSLDYPSSYTILCFPYFEIEKKLIPVLAAIAGRIFFLGFY